MHLILNWIKKGQLINSFTSPAKKFNHQAGMFQLYKRNVENVKNVWRCDTFPFLDVIFYTVKSTHVVRLKFLTWLKYTRWHRLFGIDLSMQAVMCQWSSMWFHTLFQITYCKFVCSVCMCVSTDPLRQWRPVWLPCWQWSPELCWRCWSCEPSSCLALAWVIAHLNIHQTNRYTNIILIQYVCVYVRFTELVD